MTRATPRNDPDARFWRSVAARLAAILVVGCVTVVWFQGCLVPLIKDEIRQDQQKEAGPLDAAH